MLHHFEFKLIHFRLKTFSISSNRATIYGYSKEFGRDVSFKILGHEKINAFKRNIIAKSDFNEYFLLYSDTSIFAVTISNKDIEKSDYLLVHSSTEDKNDLMSLEELDSFLYSLVTK